MIKILVIGDCQVGKSAFVGRFCEDTFFPSYEPTKSFEMKVVNPFEFEHKKYKLQVIDFGTSNVAQALKMATPYLKQADALILAYDITNQHSFENLEKIWFPIAQKAPNKTVVVIIGCKSDLESKRQVSSDQVQQFCESSSVPISFFETSAKSTINIKQVFEEIILNSQVKNDSTQILHRRTQSALPLGKFFQGNHSPRSNGSASTPPTSPPFLSLSMPTSPNLMAENGSPANTIPSIAISPVSSNVDLEKENAHLKSQIKDLQQDFEALQKEFSTKKVELKRQIQHLEEEVSKTKILQEQNSKLEQELASLQQNLLPTATPITENNEILIEELESKIRFLEKELVHSKQYNTIHENHGIHNASAQQVIEQYKLEISDYEQQMEQCKVELNRLKKQHMEQMKLLKQTHDTQLQSLQLQIQQLKLEKEKANETVQKLLQERATLEQDKFLLQQQQQQQQHASPIAKSISSPSTTATAAAAAVVPFVDALKLPVMDTKPQQQQKVSLSEYLFQGDADAKENLLLIISEEEFSNLDPISGIQKSIINIMRQFKKGKQKQQQQIPLLLNAQLMESLLKLFQNKFYNPWFFSKADAWDVILEIYNGKGSSSELYTIFKEGVDFAQKETKGWMNESHVLPLRMNMMRVMFMKWLHQKQLVNGLCFIFSQQHIFERFYQRDAPIVQKRNQVEVIEHCKVLNAVSLEWVPIGCVLK